MCDFSLIIACYCDAPHLRANTLELVQLLKRLSLSFEVVFVEDCSPDHTLKEVQETVNHLEQEGVATKLLVHKQNMGRGRSVADGIRAASGTYVGFIDIDLEHLPDAIPVMLNRLLAGAEVVVARRVIENPWDKPLRVLSSAVYRLLVHQLLDLPVSDTEAGLKLFHRQRILPVLDVTRDEKWFWDTEIIDQAQRHGLRIEEHPIVFLEKPEKKSTVRLLPDTIAYLKAIARYKRRLCGSQKIALKACCSDKQS